MRLAFEADREARFAGAAPVMIQTVASDPNARVAYPGRDSHDYMMSEAERCPSWVNEITLRSLNSPVPTNREPISHESHRRRC